jgi:hypothetical protein
MPGLSRASGIMNPSRCPVRSAAAGIGTHATASNGQVAPRGMTPTTA